MKNLTRSLLEFTKSNRDGSLATQADRRLMLKLFSNQLTELGYRKMTAQSLKLKHIKALIEKWKLDKVSEGTIKNRMSVLRWWSRKVGKNNLIPRDNKELGLKERTRLPTKNIAYSLKDQDTRDLPKYIKDSLRLQDAFGLRREESAKLVPNIAFSAKDKLYIVDSWAKGGRSRSIDIITDEQRDLVDHLKATYGNNSLIPESMNYARYLSHRETHLKKSDIRRTHGLRHNYAQQRYRQLTGNKPPRMGGPKYAELSAKEQSIDVATRLKISEELGHSRLDITKVYLG